MTIVVTDCFDDYVKSPEHVSDIESFSRYVYVFVRQLNIERTKQKYNVLSALLLRARREDIF